MISLSSRSLYLPGERSAGKKICPNLVLFSLETSKPKLFHNLDTLGKMLGPDLFEKFKKQKGDDGMILPENVADTYFFLAQQTKSTWTNEIDIRAFSDQAWWNH